MVQNFKKYNNIFFVGIGGISMSALATLCKKQGANVSGSDLKSSVIISNLKKLGIKVFLKHKGKNITGAELVVYSGAIKQNNPELLEAKKLNIPTMERAEFLGKVSENFEKVIAISGTHGKTTTTSMIAHIFMVANLNPTVHLGGMESQIGGNLQIGGSKYFITEACEFRDSFLKLNPTVSVVTNVEFEHVDYFKTFAQECQSFSQFAKLTKKVCFVSKSAKKCFLNDKNVHFIGEKMSFNAQNIILNDDGKYSFDLYCKKNFLCNLKLNVYGKHNIQNALLAIAVARYFDIDMGIIQLAMRTYKAVQRRFEQIGFYGSNIIVQDYAHHPTEIICSINTCKEVFGRKIMCVFQPHTYSRTKRLIDSFTKCFNGLDCLVLLETYPARESFEYFGSAQFLKKKLENNNPPFAVQGVFDFKEFMSYIKSIKISNAVILFLGAGDIESLARDLAKKRKLCINSHCFRFVDFKNVDHKDFHA